MVSLAAIPNTAVRCAAARVAATLASVYTRSDTTAPAATTFVRTDTFPSVAEAAALQPRDAQHSPFDEAVRAAVVTERALESTLAGIVDDRVLGADECADRLATLAFAGQTLTPDGLPLRTMRKAKSFVTSIVEAAKSKSDAAVVPAPLPFAMDGTSLSLLLPWPSD
jgi:hypothetical protein